MQNVLGNRLRHCHIRSRSHKRSHGVVKFLEWARGRREIHLCDGVLTPTGAFLRILRRGGGVTAFPWSSLYLGIDDVVAECPCRVQSYSF